ncbi:hypothetical protein HD554DRAFT_2177360 [Boletus coccyginus]|nr:hypothetical protein HD554DRAFT_2177360 [Boletus coccyginus]
MSSTSPVQLGPTYGAELLATFLSTALWGTTCVQTLIYFIHYPNDKLLLKVLVVWLWLADTVHQMLIVKGVYDSQIVHFCDYNRVENVIPEFLWQVLLTVHNSRTSCLDLGSLTLVQSLVSISSQTFFTYRIWRFSGRRWFYWALLAPVCLFELAGALVFIALGTMAPTAAELVSPVAASIYTAIQAAEAGADLTIAAVLTVLLIKSRERALDGTRSVLQKLVVLTINTGIWTAFFAVFTFVAILAFKNTLVYAAAYLPLCPLYCNTVLTNLNARNFLKARSASAEHGSPQETVGA